MYRRMELLPRYGILLIALLLVGCQGATNAEVPVPTPTRPTIGVSLSTLSNPFFIAIQNGALEAANRLDADLVVQNAQNHVGRQRQQVERLVEQNVDALIINPVDGEVAGALVAKANDAGIPVFTVDRSATSGEVVTHIASDNAAGGEMAAAFVLDLIGDEGAVVELQGTAGTSAAEERGQAFAAALAEHPGIDVVARESADFDRWEAKRAMERILAEQAEIDAVFAHNDPMILGAIEAAQAAGRAREIYFVGFDGIGDAITAIEQGELTATIAQQPAEMGRLAVELAVDYLRNGEPLPDLTPVDLALVAQ